MSSKNAKKERERISKKYFEEIEPKENKAYENFLKILEININNIEISYSKFENKLDKLRKNTWWHNYFRPYKEKEEKVLQKISFLFDGNYKLLPEMENKIKHLEQDIEKLHWYITGLIISTIFFGIFFLKWLIDNNYINF